MSKTKDFFYYEVDKHEDFNLWIDFWYQMELIKSVKPKNILEIGKGTGTLEVMLERRGFAYTTVDIDERTNPDIVADIRDLPFKANSFDVVCAFEVLEHIPFKDVKKALKEMRRVSRRYVIISIPYACVFISFAFQLFYARFLDPLFRFFKMEPFKPKYVNIAIPLFFLDKYGMISEHRWEMGRKKYPVKRIRSLFKEVGFKIVKESSRIFYPYHRFFILEKNDIR